MAQQATLSLTLAGGSEVPGDRGLAIDLSRVDIETALDMDAIKSLAGFNWLVTNRRSRGSMSGSNI